MVQSAVREELYNSVRVFWLDSDLVIRMAGERARELVASGRAETVILFGSIAAGRAVPGSDADILVIVRDGKVCENNLRDEFIRHFSGIGVPVDLFLFREGDPESSLVRRARESGIVLASR